MKRAKKDAMPPAEDGEEDVPIQPKSIKALTSMMLKRTYDMFVGNHSQKLPLDEQAQRAKIASKVRKYNQGSLIYSFVYDHPLS
jgi:hypothetical protein